MDGSSLESILLAAVEKFDEKSDVVSELQDKLKHLEPDEELRRLSIELGLRSIALMHVASKTSDSNSLLLASKLVSLALRLTESGCCDAKTSVAVLADLLDAFTMDMCSQLFDQCLANKLDMWNNSKKFAGIKPHILRLCNDLLRRSSRSMDTVFCGRIQLFLAKFFPVNERSALNIVSEFNLDNVTDFNQDKEAFDDQLNSQDNEDDDDLTDKKDEPMQIEPDAKNINVDYELYRKIWLLQDYFRNPTQCYDRIKWKTFSKFAQDVLNVLSSFKLDSAQRTVSSRKSQSKFFAKYLTNQNLLQLQLSDSDFRRNVLIQFLILFQYLVLPVKFKTDTQVLTTEQERWVTGATSKVYSLLVETPPDGASFAHVVKHVLKREEQWIKWKNDGCPPFKANKEKNSSSANNGVNNAALGIGGSRRMKRKLGDMVQDASTKKRCLMGNQHLTRLWNICPDNMEACASAERDFLPDLQSFLRDAFEQLDPNNQIEDEYKKVNDGSWGWRALRLLATKSPHFFTFSNQPIARLPDYLEQKIKKLFQENNWGTLPTLITPNNTEEDAKSSNNDGSSKVTPEQIAALSKSISKNWSKLIPKLGLPDESKIAIEKSLEGDEGKAKMALEKWVEIEKEAASKDELLYVLEALKLKDSAQGVLF